MKIVGCFGDSLIYGFPFGPQASWLKEVENITGHKLINYGVCGDCCDDILEHLKHTPLPDAVIHILVLGGVNDLIQKRPIECVLSDLTKIEAYCQNCDLKLVFILPWLTDEVELNVKIEKLRVVIKSEFQNKTLLLDLQQAIETVKLSGKPYLDGVHPKRDTYKTIGAYAAPLINKWLEQDNCN